MEYFPVSLNLKNQRCIVAGAGEVAERKVKGLLAAGARIILISPLVTKRLKSLSRSGKIRYIARKIKSGDLNKAFLIIAATDDKKINQDIFGWANRKNILVNVVDSPESCNFIVPSVLRRGHLTISISTEGVSPALSRNIRLSLGKAYGERFAKYLDLIADFRKRIKAKYADAGKRKKVLQEIAGGKFIRLVRSGNFKGIKSRLNKLIR